MSGDLLKKVNSNIVTENSVKLYFSFLSNTKLKINVNEKKLKQYPTGPKSESFLGFIKLLKVFLKNNNSNFNDILICPLPMKKKALTLLRAPYRYKLARDQIYFSRFKFLVIVIFKIHQTFGQNNNIYEIVEFLKYFNKNFKNFSTNLCTLQSCRIKFFNNLNFKNFLKKSNLRKKNTIKL